MANFPQFPYSGNQIILSSDRVMIHSKNDAIFLFGKAAVGISSTKTINLDAKQEIYLSSSKVYLGSAANKIDNYQPSVLGDNLTNELLELYSYLSNVAKILGKVNESNLASWVASMRSSANLLDSHINRRIIDIKNGYLKSKNVYNK
jgi:hypothetical protein